MVIHDDLEMIPIDLWAIFSDLWDMYGDLQTIWLDLGVTHSDLWWFSRWFAMVSSDCNDLYELSLYVGR